MNDMTPSPELIEHVKASESLVLVPAPDPAGLTTWGWGHKGKAGEYVPPAITQDHAETLLAADLHVASQAVRRHVTAEMTQDQFDAFTDFTFNLGEGNFAGSTMLANFNSGDIGAAAAQCLRWDHAHVHGQLAVLAGLKVRREWDAAHIDPEGAAAAAASETDEPQLEFPTLDTSLPAASATSEQNETSVSTDTPTADAA